MTELQEDQRNNWLKTAQLLPKEIGTDVLSAEKVNRVGFILRWWVSREDFRVGWRLLGLLCKTTLENQSKAECQGTAKVTDFKPLDLKNGEPSLEGEVVCSRSQKLYIAESRCKAGQSLGRGRFLGIRHRIPSNRTENLFSSCHHWLIWKEWGGVCSGDGQVSPKLPEAAGFLWQLQGGQEREAGNVSVACHGPWVLPQLGSFLIQEPPSL